jgi:ABC-type Mn2+/Zn2+ transport system ATPase subunit
VLHKVWGEGRRERERRVGYVATSFDMENVFPSSICLFVTAYTIKTTSFAAIYRAANKESF